MEIEALVILLLGYLNVEELTIRNEIVVISRSFIISIHLII